MWLRPFAAWIQYNFPLTAKKGLATTLGVPQTDIDAADFGSTTDGLGKAVFLKWCELAQNGPDTTLVPGNLRSDVWWTPDEPTAPGYVDPGPRYAALHERED